MKCPKCGVTTQEGRADCPSCGIVFARWRPREARPAASSAPRVAAPASDFTRYWVGVPVALLVLLGLLMMSGGGDENATQANIAAVAKKPAPKAKTEGRVETELQTELRAMLEECSFFQERVVYAMPKSFVVRDAASILSANPGLIAAEQMTLFRFEPRFTLSYAIRDRSSYNGNEFINVTLTDRGTSMPGVSETSNEYRFDLGYRRLLSVVPDKEVDGKIKARWYWSVENTDLLQLATGINGQAVGLIEAERTATGWANVKIKRGTGDNADILCEW